MYHYTEIYELFCIFEIFPARLHRFEPMRTTLSSHLLNDFIIIISSLRTNWIAWISSRSPFSVLLIFAVVHKYNGVRAQLVLSGSRRNEEEKMRSIFVIRNIVISCICFCFGSVFCCWLLCTLDSGCSCCRYLFSIWIIPDEYIQIPAWRTGLFSHFYPLAWIIKFERKSLSLRIRKTLIRLLLYIIGEARNLIRFCLHSFYMVARVAILRWFDSLRMQNVVAFIISHEKRKRFKHIHWEWICRSVHWQTN